MRRLPILLPFAALAACTAAPTPPPTVPPPPPPYEVQLLALNDFHGNLETPEGAITYQDGAAKPTARLGGAAQLGAALQRLRAGHDNGSVTVAAGDLIGASPLASSYFLDEPTVDALSLAGLSIASVGNHEFDRGTGELMRMQKGGCEQFTRRTPCALEPFKGAGFTYLAANVQRADGSTLFPATAIRQLGPVKVGFIGLTLKDTGILASPAGVVGLRFADEADTANALVPRLKAEGADAIVLLIHQGAKWPVTYATQGCDGLAGPILGILDRLDPAIRVVVSGHTHHAYACTLDRGGAERLLTSAGKYAYFVTDIRMSIDPAGHRLIGATGVNVPIVAEGASDPAIAALTSRYVAAAAPIANRPVGKLSGPAMRSEAEDESPAANLVADAMLAASKRAGAQVAFTNATGIRTNLVPKSDGTVTFGSIFQMQPFGNNLVTKTYSGAELKAVLEQMFDRGDGNPRVVSLLIPSDGFRYRYDLKRPVGNRIVSMTLAGQPIDPAGRYRVTVNNFLASGGDGFSALTAGRDAADSGLDLDAMEAWLKPGRKVPPLGRTRD